MIITVAAMKGGCGKSTLAGALALVWKEDGRTVAVVDADPQGSVGAWEGLGAVTDHSDKVADTIAAQARSHDVVIVDTAGFNNRASVGAIAAADVCLIPAKASAMDGPVTLKAWGLVNDINQTEERHKRPVKAAVVLNMVVPRATITAQAREELEEAGVHVLAPQVGNRVAFGYLPAGLPLDATAKAEVQALARAIEEL